jgi:hypothetical protein
LSFRFLALALQVLLPALALQALIAQQVAEGLFAGAEGLVPRALGAVGAVFGGGARGAEGDGADLEGGLGGGVFGSGTVAGLVGFGLR